MTDINWQMKNYIKTYLKDMLMTLKDILSIIALSAVIIIGMSFSPIITFSVLVIILFGPLLLSIILIKLSEYDREQENRQFNKKEN